MKTGAIPLAPNETHSSISAQLRLCYIKRFCFASWEFGTTKKPFFFIIIHNCTVMFGVGTKLKSCCLLLPWPFLFPHSSCRDGGSWQQAKPSWQVGSLLALLPSGCDASLSSAQCWKSLWATWRWNIYYLLVTQGTVSVFIGLLPLKPNIPSVGSSRDLSLREAELQLRDSKMLLQFQECSEFPLRAIKISN